VHDTDANKAVLDTVTLILTMARTVFIAELRGQPLWVRVDVLEALERAEETVLERWRAQLERRSSQPEEKEPAPVVDGPVRCPLCKRETAINTFGAYVRHLDEGVMGVCKGSGKPARHG
jgi:hypothetical protein